MSCCAPGTEGSLQIGGVMAALPSAEELMLASKDLGEGLRQSDLSVPAVYCGTCISTIERALKTLPMVERARVNLSSKRVSIVWREQSADGLNNPEDLIKAISSTGYQAHLFTNAQDVSDRLRQQLIRAVAVCGFASVNIMLLSISVWSGADASTRDLFHWISALIAAPALIYGGRFYYQSAWNAVTHGTTNMDVPIALAITLSYIVSLWETMHSGAHAWFDATASLLFFLLIGRTLDHIMRDRARSAIAGLAQLSPRGVMVIEADGTRDYRPIDDVKTGEIIAITAGERVGLDAEVLTGKSDIDFSIVNGESAPRLVGEGDQLLAGTFNLTGALTARVTATAKYSFLSEIIGLMEAAEGGRARYRRIADRAAQYYSPVVHLLALASFIGWGLYDGDWKHAMLVAIAVLIITCPCALGLAVPVVQVVAAGRLFNAGILVKDGSAMERLAEIDTALFDKTGTLTLGQPRVINLHEVDPEVASIAAALAQHSRHPLSRALSNVVFAKDIALSDIHEIAGSGMEGKSASGTYRLGNRRFACGSDAHDFEQVDGSEVVLSRDGVFVARFTFADQLRNDASETIAALNHDGIATEVVSGDRQDVVGKLAAKIGISRWNGELSPQEKAERCNVLRENGAKVLMVGDGINDAPALSCAHVSIAPATAADIGRQAADFVFLREGLGSVVFALRTAKAAGNLIRQNFGLAIGYNVIAVPIALAGMATPMVAAIAMSTSSLIVVANSLRLNWSRDAEPERSQIEQAMASVNAQEIHA
jgi:Cu2+-exporting ATPase